MTTRAHDQSDTSPNLLRKRPLARPLEAVTSVSRFDDRAKPRLSRSCWHCGELFLPARAL